PTAPSPRARTRPSNVFQRSQSRKQQRVRRSDALQERCHVRTKMWTAGGTLAIVVTIGVATALFERTTAAQASRQQVPLFEPDPLWSQSLPNKWVTGQVGGLAVDSHDNLWVFHRPDTIPDGEKAASLIPPQAECCMPAPAVLEFDTNGRFLQAWGGAGQGYEWPASEHGIYIDYQ